MAKKRNFTLREFFDEFGLNQGKVAELAGIYPTLFRQYVVGVKNPSDKRLKVIEEAIHKLGNELQKIKIVS